MKKLLILIAFTLTTLNCAIAQQSPAPTPYNPQNVETIKHIIWAVDRH
jgi:hypothetical protein